MKVLKESHYRDRRPGKRVEAVLDEAEKPDDNESLDNIRTNL